MQLKIASYNIHKGIGLDRKRDPDRILSVLAEIDADIVALQECDRRFGRRECVLPRARIEDSRYRPVPIDTRPDSMGWHGNGFLVKKTVEVIDTAALTLPALEPRGAVRVDLRKDGKRVRVIGMHLDLSGLRRRHQIRSVLAHCADCDHHVPTVMMGDLNEWSQHGGCLQEFHQPGWKVLSPGRSFPSRRPIARLDRIIVSAEWQVLGTNVHHSPLSATGSDHLPVFASLSLPKN